MVLCWVQDTVQEMAKDMRSSRDSTVQASAEELYQFMKRVGQSAGRLHRADDVSLAVAVGVKQGMRSKLQGQKAVLASMLHVPVCVALMVTNTFSCMHSVVSACAYPYPCQH